MVKRATIADVAKASGVSVATVNRVLGGGAAVRDDTLTRVRDAAQDVGFYAAGLIGKRAEQAKAHIDVGILLQDPEYPFYADLTRRLDKALRQTGLFRGTASFDYWETQEPDEIAERLLKLARRNQAVALVSPDHPTIAEAIQEIRSKGKPVFALLSDCAPAIRTSYIGIDNRRAGRTAGWAIAHCARQTGRVAVFVGSHRFHGHELREIGLRSYFREHAPDFTMMDTEVNGESADNTYRALSAMLAEGDVAGCYVTGGGASGAVSAIRELTPDKRPVLICNDAPFVARAALTEGLLTMTLAEPIDRLCQELVSATAQSLGDDSAGVAGQIFAPFEIYTPENI